MKVVETETHRDFEILRMSRPRLIETLKFCGCRDRDSSRPFRFGGYRDRDQSRPTKSCRDRDFIESLAIHCIKATLTTALCSVNSDMVRGQYTKNNTIFFSAVLCQHRDIIVILLIIPNINVTPSINYQHFMSSISSIYFL